MRTIGIARGQNAAESARLCQIPRRSLWRRAADRLRAGGSVAIERTYARKLLLKHRLRYEHFQMIQPTIERGYVVIDGGGNLVFAYDDQERFHARFRLAVKTTDARDELWLRTFHRIKLAQMNSLVRRFRLIREHQTREHMEPE